MMTEEELERLAIQEESRAEALAAVQAEARNEAIDARAATPAPPKKKHSAARTHYVPMKRNEELPIYAMRVLADPYKEGRIAYPFAVGFHDGVAFRSWFGDNALEEARAYLVQRDRGVVYFYDGDGRDFYLILDWFEGTLLIHGSVMIGGAMAANLGNHKIRDSVTMYLGELADYRGLNGAPAPPETPLEHQERDQRDQHKDAILRRLGWECGAVWQTMTEFNQEFPGAPSLGAAAMDELEKRHWFARLPKKLDSGLRELFYFGGRCECLVKPGMYEGNFEVHDVNSMYPYTMKNFHHPVGKDMTGTEEITDETCFIICNGWSRGHVPWRDFEIGNTYYTPQGFDDSGKRGAPREFCMTIHEWRMAHQLGLLEVDRIVACFNFAQQTRFDRFVNDFHGKRVKAIRRGDLLHAGFYKNILNAASGKPAQNPHNVFAYEILRDDVELEDPQTFRDCYDCQHEKCFEHWTRAFPIESLQKVIWRLRRESPYVLNVAMSASFTGAARAVLMRGIVTSTGVKYVDTDAMICEALGAGLRQHPDELGAWKLEARGNRLALAGPKRYALFADICPTCGGPIAGKDCPNTLFHLGNGCVKMAHAGWPVPPQEIEALALRKKKFVDVHAMGRKLTLERIGQAIVKRYTLAGGKVQVTTGLEEQAFRIVEEDLPQVEHTPRLETLNTRNRSLDKQTKAEKRKKQREKARDVVGVGSGAGNDDSGH